MNKDIRFETTQKIRIDDFLRQNLPSVMEKDGFKKDDFSNSKIRRLILSGSVIINQKTITRPAFELRGKSVISVSFNKEKFFFEKQPDDIQFEVTQDSVLYEDDNLIFINKPAFFPVEQTITGNRNNLHDCVVNYLWKKNPALRNPPYVGIMHRLDRTTSGVILFTKTRPANKIISTLFESHNFTKEYLAVCPISNSQKNKTGETFTVEMFMGRVSGKSHAGKWGKTSEADGGQFSKTSFSIIKEITIEDKRCYLIKCTLFTGRTHQIRVHLSESGLPILGDTLYGAPEAKRIYLHAHKMVFTNELGEYDITAPVPW